MRGGGGGVVFVLFEKVEGSVFLILISILVTDLLAHVAFSLSEFLTEQ